MTTEHDNEIIREGAARLREALSTGRVSLNRIAAQQATDLQTVKVREYWGDHNEEQQLITHGIKLRIAAREEILAGYDD